MSHFEGWHHLLSDRLAEARTAFSAESGADGLLGLGCVALPTGHFQEIWEPWSELVRLHSQHWSAAAVIPMLVEAGGGLEAQERLSQLLKRQRSQGSAPFASLVEDLLGPTQRLRWKISADSEKKRWHTMRPGADPSAVDLEQIRTCYQLRFYAATAFESEEEVETTLDCDLGSGEVRIWLNHEMVLRARREQAHHWAGMPYRAHIKLQAGKNFLLVQLDRPEFGSVNFRLRLGVGVVPGRPAELSPPEHEIPPVASWLLEAIPAECRLLHADYLWRLGLEDQAHRHLSHWVEAYPKSGLLSWLAARWEGFSRGPKNKVWQAHRQAIPDWNSPSPAEHDRFLSQGRFPLEDGRAEVQHFSPRLAYAPLVEAALPQLSELLRQFPGHPWLLERRLSLMTPYSAPVDIEHIPADELREAATLMEALGKKYPNGWGWDYQRLAAVYRRLGEKVKASRYYRKAASYRPWDPDAWETLADHETDPSKAVRAYQKALKLSPNRIGLRDKIEQCRGAAPLLEALSPAEPCQPSWDLQAEEVVCQQEAGFYDVCDSQHPARVILLEEMRQVVYSDGASYGLYRLVAETPEDRVFSPGYPTPMKALRTTVVTSRLYRQDGRVQDTLELGQGDWPAFPDCAEGDIAEAVWEASAAGFAGFCQEWTLGPAARYALIHPADETLYATRPSDISETRGGWSVDTWTSPGPLKVSTFSKWPDLARALRRHLLRPPTPSAQALARRLGSARAILQWCREGSSEWKGSEREMRAAGRFGSGTFDAVLLCGLLGTLNVRADLCFPIRDAALPGTWFGKAVVQVFEPEPSWSSFPPPRPGTPLLNLTLGNIQWT